MKIKNIEIKNPLVLAPLAGITNLPFRKICKAQGAGLVCSEMISSNGLIYNSGKTRSMIKSSEFEKPLSIQLFGYDPDIMADAAKMIEESSQAQIIDINMGCSVKKILKSNSGSALMKDPEKVEKIFTKIKKTINLPLTVKIRSGWDNSGNDALLIAKIAQNCGLDALAIHPRTAKQGFSGKADWSLIKKIKKSIDLPVIGNGDIKTWEDALKMFEQTNCDAVMIGRASISNPFIFREINQALKGEKPSEVSVEEHFVMMKFYFESTIKHFGEETACKMMRSRLSWFVRGLPHNTFFKEKIKNISNHNKGLEIIEDYKLKLEQINQANLN
ncbi:MAG: tRNA dihydrouridine synthase DusB [Desulforegulaceae bacterium]|nr:tRNA dihydrouridine synthase DusB [Desulforegulaceae bacterium]